MTKLKWEEGKMYQIRIDMVDKYLSLFEICKDIFNVIGYKTFMVQDIDREGRVTKLVGISNDILDIDYWFYPSEIKYFDLVENSDVEYRKEKQMKYKCIKDFWMEDRLRENKPAFSAGVVYEFYQVEGIDDLRTDNDDQGLIHYMPMCDINEHFELVEEEQEMSPTKTEQEIVVEWLDKLHYVMLNDDHVEDIRPCSVALILSTTLSDIYGIEQIYNFIQMRYNQMIIAEVGRRKKELLDKRAALELELAEINKELGE